MNSWRLIESPAATGGWNMAVDAALMESVATTGQCCLRFYTWSEPTVSLGYFQNATDRDSHAASHACPLVRRSTGGGAIVHDREITYSLVMPTGNSLVAHPPELYGLLHRTLIAALARHGVEAGEEMHPLIFGKTGREVHALCCERFGLSVDYADWSAFRRRRRTGSDGG